MVKAAQVPSAAAEANKSSGIYAVILSELCTICCGACLSIEFIIWTHVWAVLYTLLGLYLQSIPSLRKQVDGYPLFCYFLALSNHFMLPIPVILAYVYTPSFTEWLDGPANSYGPLVFYSIAGSMIKDAWLIKEVDHSMFNFGLFMHHMAVIAGCALSLSLAYGFGYATLIAIVAEAGSAAYALYVIFPSRMSAGIYILVMFLSNVCGLNILTYVTNVKNGVAINTLYAILFIGVFCFRVTGWGLVILYESSGKAKTTARTVFIEEFFESLSVKGKSVIKMS